MAEDVENPRKKQKLDDISLKASAIEESPKSPKDLGIKDHEEKPQNADDMTKSDGGEERLNSDDLHTSDTEQPSSSQMDLSDSGSDTDSSSMSPLSGEELWKGDSEPLAWVYKMMANEEDPRTVLKELLPNEVPDLDDMSLWRLLMAIVSEPPARDKLPFVNTISDVIHLIKTCKNIIVLTGAGVSVSCGIPDFRSRNGIYARLAVDFPDLPDPQAMFDIGYFKRDQRPFYKFAKEIYPGEFEPSKCHRFIRLIEEHGKLLRNYTQNIDTLEQVAGIKNVIQCHGSFATATCMVCKHKCSGDDIKKDIYNQVIPKCPKCDPQLELSIMKPDIVFFGESLPNEFHRQMAADKEKCDLLIVIGSSLKVRPVALIPNSLPSKVPQILINKEHLRALNFDVELLGDCDIIIGELCRQLGGEWDTLANKINPLKEIRVDELLTPPVTPVEIKDKPSEVLDIKDSNTNDRNSAKSNENKITNIEKSRGSITSNENVDNQSNIPEEEKSCYSGKHLNSATKDEDNNQACAINPSDGLAYAESREESVAKTDSRSEKDSTQDATVNKTDTEGTKNPLEEEKKGSDSKEGPGSSKLRKDINLSSMWIPAKWRVSQRLQPYQYCFMPPNRYVFNDAEVFMLIDSDSDMESTDESYREKDESDNQKPEITEEEKDGSNKTENTTESPVVEKEKQTESEIAGKPDSINESSERTDVGD